MANRNVVTRAGGGASIDISGHDQNINAFVSTSEEQTGATYEVVYTDQGKLIELNNASMVVTLDAVADIVAAMDSGLDSFSVTLKNTNAAEATINRSSTDTIDGATSITLQFNQSVTLQTNAAQDGWLRKAALLQTYAGRVSGSNPATSSTLPTGWTAATTGTGQYTITHNLGVASGLYAAVITCHNSTGTFVFVARNVSLSPNSFSYAVDKVDGTATNLSTSFIMMLP